MIEYIEDFEEIITEFCNQQDICDEYIQDIRKTDNQLIDFLTLNKYVTYKVSLNFYLLQKLLGKELYDLVEWFIFDVPVYQVEDYNIMVNGVKYLVNDKSSLIDLVKHGYGLKSKPIY